MNLAVAKFECGQDLVSGYSELFDAKHPIHVDEEFAKATKYGRCIAHGPLVLSQAITAVGEIFGESVSVLLDISEWHFYKPVFVGGALQLQCFILDVKRSKSGSTGAVTIEIRITDDTGSLLQRGVYSVLLKAEKI